MTSHATQRSRLEIPALRHIWPGRQSIGWRAGGGHSSTTRTSLHHRLIMYSPAMHFLPSGVDIEPSESDFVVLVPGTPTFQKHPCKFSLVKRNPACRLTRKMSENWESLLRPKPRPCRDAGRRRRIGRPIRGVDRVARAGGCRARPRCGSMCPADRPGLHLATQVRSAFRAHVRGSRR